MSIVSILMVVAVVFALVSVAMLFYTRAQLRANQQANHDQLSVLEHKLELVNRGAMGVGKRLIAVEKNLQATRQKQAFIEQEVPSEMLYNRAIDMFKGGASLESVMASCQLSQAECLLIERIHKASNEPA
jgi:hypothetical protein